MPGFRVEVEVGNDLVNRKDVFDGIVLQFLVGAGEEIMGVGGCDSDIEYCATKNQFSVSPSRCYELLEDSRSGGVKLGHAVDAARQVFPPSGLQSRFDGRFPAPVVRESRLRNQSAM